MKKITLLLLFFMTALTYGQDFVNCSQTFSVSGPDSAGTQLIINAADITCNDGLAINSISVASATGSFTSGFCSLTGGGWFEFFLSIDGGAEQAVCAAELNGLDLTGFSSLVITSSDTDDFTDNITMTLNLDVEHEAPSCEAPTGLVATVIDPFEVSLDWGTVANASQYEWFIFEAGANVAEDAPVDSGISGGNFTFSSALSPSTDYFFFVVSDCDADGQSSPSAQVSFTTPCAPESALFFETETFDGMASDINASLACWNEGTGFFTTVANGQWGPQTFNNNEGGVDNGFGTSLYVNLFGTRQDWVTSPQIDLGAGNPEFALTFDAYVRPWSISPTNPVPVTSMGDHSVVVYISTDGGDTWDEANELIRFDSSNIPNDLNDTNFIIDLSTYSGTIQIGFLANQVTTTPDLRFYIDNFFVGIPPSCVAPTGLAVAEVTVDSAELSWNEVDNADEYVWAVFAEGANPDVDTPVATGTTDLLMAEATGLQPETAYFAIVASECDGVFSAISNQVAFTTLPSCVAVENVVASLASQSEVEVSWDAVDNAESYNWALFLASDNPEVDAPAQDGTTSSTSVVIEDLDADENYVVLVQTNCGDVDGLSGVSTSVSFFTGYCIPSSTNLGDYISQFSTSEATQNISISKSSIVGNGFANLFEEENIVSFAGGSFSFSNTFVGGGNGLQIWIDWNKDLQFSEDESVFVLNNASLTKTGSIDIPEGIALGDYRMRIRAQWNGTPGPCGVIPWGEAIDVKLTLTDPPSCLAPDGLQVDDVTTTTATLSWDVVDNAENYTWFVFEAGDNPEVDTPVATGTTATTSALVEGLEDASSYQAYVLADCDVDGESELSSAVVFATSCNSVDVFPYEYGFEGDGSLDVCWEANNLSGSGNWTVATVSQDNFQPNSGDYLAYLIWSGGLKTAELISAPLNLSAIGGPAEMSIFLHRHSGANATNDFYKIHINDTPSLSGATELLQIFSRNDIEPTVPSNGFYEYTMSIPESFESSTEAYIIIEGSASGWDIAVDDFSIYAAPEPTFANVQIIHNSPDPAAALVDIYVDGELDEDLTGVAFRTATPFINVPADTSYEIDVVPSGEPLSASVFTATLTVEADENYIVVANGVVSTDLLTAPNFELSVYTGAQLVAMDNTMIDVLVHHGSPDAPAVDVAVPGFGTIVTDLAFPQFEGYLSFIPGNNFIEVYPAGSNEALEVYLAPLGDLPLEGQAITVIASGFLGDDAGEDNAFGLWVATAAGGALIELPVQSASSVDFDATNFTYYPNPVKNQLTIKSANTVEKVEVFNMLGQRVISQNPNSNTPSVQMGELTSGVYLMKVSINGSQKSFQVIKQ